MPFLDLPPFRWRITLRTGDTILVPPNHVKRTLDKRFPNAPPLVVYEVQLPNGLVTRLWPEDIASLEQEGIGK